MSSLTIGSGIFPQPIPSFKSICLEPRSARRQVLAPTTPSSNPSVNFERSVRTSWTCSRPAPGRFLPAFAKGWDGAATGISWTKPAPIRSMPSISISSGPLTPITALRSSTICATAPNAST
ncbi:hypothetical protein D9M70_508310 [compost metagenome]